MSLNKNSDNTNNNNSNNDSDKSNRTSWITIIVLFIWLLLGGLAYAYSFNCTSERFSGGEARKIAMFLLALVFGPFWWLILPFAKSEGYCKLK